MTLKTLILAFCLMILSVTGWADFYQVDHVSVKATDENAKQAKAQAMELAQIQAFSRLIYRLTGKEVKNLPETQEIISMVQDVSIQDEKKTTTDYWATLNVGFYPERIQTYLKTNGWDFLQKEPPKLLVIPVHQKGGVILSGLEEENPLFQFLRSQEILSDFYPLLLPNGDLDEIVLVNQNLKKPEPIWDVLIRRYGADGVLLLQAEDIGQAHWQLTGQVFVDNRLLQQGQAFDWYQGYSLPQAWAVFMQQMEQDWRENQQTQDDRVYYARLTEPNLQAWVRDKKQLEQLKFIKNILVQGMSHNQMLISFIYQGNSGDMVQDWAQAGWIWKGDLMSPSGSLTRKDVYYE